MKNTITFAILLLFCITGAKTNAQIDVGYSGAVTSKGFTEHLEKVRADLDENKPNINMPPIPNPRNCELTYPDFGKVKQEIEGLLKAFEYRLVQLKKNHGVTEEQIKEAIAVEKLHALPEDIAEAIKSIDEVKRAFTKLGDLIKSWAAWGIQCQKKAPATQDTVKTVSGQTYDAANEKLSTEQLRDQELKVFIKGEKKELINTANCKLPAPDKEKEEEKIRRKDQQIKDAQDDLKTQIGNELNPKRLLTELSIKALLNNISETKLRVLEDSNNQSGATEEYKPPIRNHVEYEALLLELDTQLQAAKNSKNTNETARLGKLKEKYQRLYGDYIKINGESKVSFANQSVEVLERILNGARYKSSRELEGTEGRMVFDLIKTRVATAIQAKSQSTNTNPTSGTQVKYEAKLLSKFSLFMLRNILNFYRSLGSYWNQILDKESAAQRIQLVLGQISQKQDPAKTEKKEFDYSYKELTEIAQELSTILNTNSPAVVDNLGGKGALARILRLKNRAREIRVKVSSLGLSALKAHYTKMGQFLTDCSANACDFKANEVWSHYKHESSIINKRINEVKATGQDIKDITSLSLEELQTGLKELLRIASLLQPEDQKTLEAHFIFSAQRFLRQTIEAAYKKSDEISLSKGTADGASSQQDANAELTKIPLPNFEEKIGSADAAKEETKIEDLNNDVTALDLSEQYPLFTLETYLKYYQTQIQKLKASVQKATNQDIKNRINKLIETYLEDGRFLAKLKEKVLALDAQDVPDYTKFSLEGIIEWINKLNEIIKSTPISDSRKIRILKVVHVALNTQRMALQQEIAGLANKSPQEILSKINVPQIPAVPKEFQSVQQAEAFKEKISNVLEALRKLAPLLELAKNQQLNVQWKMAANKCLRRMKIASTYIRIQKMLKEKELMGEQMEAKLARLETLKEYCTGNTDFDRPTTGAGGVSTCQKGKYSKDGYCWPCPYSQCSACSGPKPSDCTECANSYKMNERGLCIESGDKCADHEFERNGICYPKCRVGCKKCSDDGKICYECVSSYFLLHRRCRRRCPRFYWFHDRKGKECKRCINKCKSCAGPSMKSCSSCRNFYYLKVEKKGNETTNTCEKCPENCFRCQQTQDKSSVKCTRCRYGYKANPKTGVCEKICGDGCRRCDFRFPKICKQCETNRMIYKGKCLPGCPRGQIRQIDQETQNEFIKYEKETDPANEVRDAKTGLSSISETTSTTDININYKTMKDKEEFLNDREDPITWECVDIFSCPKETFRSVYSPGCRACDADKETAVRGFCVECSRACKGCSGSKYRCKDCADGFVKTKRGRCARKRGPPKENKCEDNQFKDNRGRCWDCHESCATCMGPSRNHCYTCTNESFKSTGRPGRPGFCTCPAGTFSQPPAEWCTKCEDANCAYCKTMGTGQCYRCQNGYFRTKQGTCMSVEENRQRLKEEGKLTTFTFKRTNPQDQAGDVAVAKGDGLLESEKKENLAKTRGAPERAIEPSSELIFPPRT